jgi:flavin-binding protein dodecin
MGRVSAPFADLDLIVPESRYRPSEIYRDKGEIDMRLMPEHVEGPATIRVIELVGVSTESWTDAAREAIARASQSIRHITGADVIHQTAIVRNGKIVEYHVDLKLAFVVESKLEFAEEMDSAAESYATG